MQMIVFCVLKNAVWESIHPLYSQKISRTCWFGSGSSIICWFSPIAGINFADRRLEASFAIGNWCRFSEASERCLQLWTGIDGLNLQHTSEYLKVHLQFASDLVRFEPKGFGSRQATLLCFGVVVILLEIWVFEFSAQMREVRQLQLDFVVFL